MRQSGGRWRYPAWHCAGEVCGSWWKGMKMGKMEETALEWDYDDDGGLTNPSLFVSLTVVWQSSIRKGIISSWAVWSVIDKCFTFSETPTWTICTFFRTNVGFGSRFLSGKTWRLRKYVKCLLNYPAKCDFWITSWECAVALRLTCILQGLLNNTILFTSFWSWHSDWTQNEN